MPYPSVCCECECASACFLPTCHSGSGEPRVGAPWSDVHIVVSKDGAAVASGTLAGDQKRIDTIFGPDYLSCFPLPSSGTYHYTITYGSEVVSGEFAVVCGEDVIVPVVTTGGLYDVIVSVKGCYGLPARGVTVEYSDGQSSVSGVTSTDWFDHPGWVEFKRLPVPFHLRMDWPITASIAAQCGLDATSVTVPANILCGETHEAKWWAEAGIEIDAIADDDASICSDCCAFPWRETLRFVCEAAGVDASLHRCNVMDDDHPAWNGACTWPYIGGRFPAVVSYTCGLITINAQLDPYSPPPPVCSPGGAVGVLLITNSYDEAPLECACPSDAPIEAGGGKVLIYETAHHPVGAVEADWHVE